MQVLLDSALDPVVERTVEAHPDRPDEALDLAIVDPPAARGTSCSPRRAATHGKTIEHTACCDYHGVVICAHKVPRDVDGESRRCTSSPQ